jgi:hypothetical protein
VRDTTEAVDRRYRELLLALPAERRLAMASEMLSTARILMREGIRAQLGPLDEAELRVQMFLRLYGDEYPPERRERIAQSIRAAARKRPR